MARDRQLHILAKRLVELSLENGFVSSERVSAVLTCIRAMKQRQQKPLLEIYLQKMRVELRSCTAQVEFASALNETSLQGITQSLKQHYNREIRVKTSENPDLLAGFRVRIADDVWDASVDGGLKQLQKII